MAESEWFKNSKKIGRWFESEVDKVLLAKGAVIVDSEPLKYRQKKGWDRLVEFKGIGSTKVEIKFDLMAEVTRNICVEDSSLNQSISPIWIYGIPTYKDKYIIDLYTMYLRQLKPFTARYPMRLVGEFKSPARIIPRYEFIDAQDGEGKVVNHFYTLTYETKPRVLLPF